MWWEVWQLYHKIHERTETAALTLIIVSISDPKKSSRFRDSQSGSLFSQLLMNDMKRKKSIYPSSVAYFSLSPPCLLLEYHIRLGFYLHLYPLEFNIHCKIANLLLDLYFVSVRQVIFYGPSFETFHSSSKFLSLGQFFKL